MNLNVGFDDFHTKYQHYTQEHQALVNEYAYVILEFGKDSEQAKTAEIIQWHAYLKRQYVLIEAWIDDSILRILCFQYIGRLSHTYSPEKCKTLLDDFIEVVTAKRNNFNEIRLFMQRNPYA